MLLGSSCGECVRSLALQALRGNAAPLERTNEIAERGDFTLTLPNLVDVAGVDGLALLGLHLLLQIQRD